MATISATWKRSVRVREYETETLELHVEKNVDMPGVNLIEEVAALDGMLAAAGDALVVERMEARAATSAPQARRPAPRPSALPDGGPMAPDPFV